MFSIFYAFSALRLPDEAFKNSNISQENAWRPFIPHFNNNMLLGFGAVLLSAFEES